MVNRYYIDDTLTALCKAFVRGATSEDHSTYIINVLPTRDSTLVINAFLKNCITIE